jgi:hypothetical protein
MDKAKVIGLTVTVLAVIGGVAVYNWVRKPKQNSEGFFNASGSNTSKANLIRCKRKDGSYYAEQDWKGCVNGAVQV